MLTALTIGLVILSIMLHELGHALAMRKYGVPLAEMGFGLPIGPKLTFSGGWWNKFGEDFKFMFYFNPLGAYVKPKNEEDAVKQTELKALREQATQKPAISIEQARIDRKVTKAKATKRRRELEQEIKTPTVCPWCEKPFLKTARNQKFCCIEHSGQHRRFYQRLKYLERKAA